jgi:hypothetical protein
MKDITVLLIDDASPKDRFVSIQRITGCDYSNLSLDCVNTHNKATRKLKKTQYDLVLYDLGMDTGEAFAEDPESLYPFSHKIRGLQPKCALIGISDAGRHNQELPDIFDGRGTIVDLFARGELRELAKSCGLALKSTNQ